MLPVSLLPMLPVSLLPILSVSLLPMLPVSLLPMLPVSLLPICQSVCCLSASQSVAWLARLGPRMLQVIEARACFAYIVQVACHIPAFAAF